MLSGKQNFVKGAVILTVATMVVKFIGMLYKIPLGNILGADGMSYFLSAYHIFNLIYALTVSGMSVAVSKLVSEEKALGHTRDVRKIRRVSQGIFLLVGVAGSVILFAGAGFFANLVGNPGAAMSVAAMAPSILFCCWMASYRGYYQGLGNMTPTALSQVVESVVKLVCGIAFAIFLLNSGLEEFAQKGTVFGTVCATQQQAELLVLPWAAAGAVLGVTVSTAIGALFLLLRGVLGKDGIGRNELAKAPVAQPAGKIAGNLIKLALPVCAAAVFSQLTNVIDLATAINRVGAAIAADPGTVLGMYAGRIPDAITREELPRFLYGIFGYTTSLFTLVPSITMALGVSGLPSVSAGWALGQRGAVAEECSSVVKLAALISIPAGLGLFALAEPILALLYPARLSEVSIAATMLRTMGIGAVLVGITTPMASLFQGLGRADIPLKLMAAGGIIKISANWVLLAVPSLNINAAPVGTVLCYAFVLVGGAICLKNIAGKGVEVLKILIKPLFCGILCATVANTSYEALARVWDNRIATLAAIAVGGLFYAIFVLFLKIITKKEAMLLPNGKKIAKMLEKLSLLG